MLILKIHISKSHAVYNIYLSYFKNYIYIFFFAIWDLPVTGKYTNCEFAHLNHDKTHYVQSGAPLTSHLPGRLQYTYG